MVMVVVVVGETSEASKFMRLRRSLCIYQDLRVCKLVRPSSRHYTGHCLLRRTGRIGERASGFEVLVTTE